MKMETIYHNIIVSHFKLYEKKFNKKWVNKRKRRKREKRNIIFRITLDEKSRTKLQTIGAWKLSKQTTWNTIKSISFFMVIKLGDRHQYGLKFNPPPRMFYN